jgi:hypothetical protein
VINAFIYDSQNGEIIRSFFSTDVEAIALNLGDGEQAIGIDATINNPYVLNGALAERPQNPATLNGIVIENIPVGAIVSFDGQSFAVNDGTAELQFQFPGTYTVEVACFPYLTKNFEVGYEG